VPATTRTLPFSALRHRNFRLFITGQFVSLCGTWMQSIALGWLVLELTDSAFAVGLVGALGALPVLLFTLQAGAMASRVNRLRAVIVLQSLMLIQAAVLAALTWTGQATLGRIILLAAFSGTLSAFEIPTRHTLVMDLVGRDDLMNAIALHSTAFNVSRVIGPALAGILTASFGPAICFTVNAVSYLAVLAGLLRIQPELAHPAPALSVPSLPATLAYVLAPGWPRALVSLSAIYTIFAVSFLTVLPVYARDVLGTDAAGYGGLTSAFGIGAAAGALVLAALGSRFRQGEVAIRTGLLIGGSLVLLGLLPWLPLALGLLVAGGAALAINAITTNTLLQMEAPEEFRGRVIGVYAFIVVGLGPFGAFQAGWVGEHLGIRLEAVLGGAVCLGATLWAIRQIPRFPQTRTQRLTTNDQALTTIPP